jgi:hypothetical protein
MTFDTEICTFDSLLYKIGLNALHFCRDSSQASAAA